MASKFPKQGQTQTEWLFDAELITMGNLQPFKP